MSDRARHHRHAEQVEIIARLTEAESEIAGLRSAVEVLLRASAVSIVRQAEIESRDLIAIKSAAFDCGYSPSAIRKWIASGKLPAVPIGGKVYVSRSALAEFLSRRK